MVNWEVARERETGYDQGPELCRVSAQAEPKQGRNGFINIHISASPTTEPIVICVTYLLYMYMQAVLQEISSPSIQLL